MADATVTGGARLTLDCIVCGAAFHHIQNGRGRYPRFCSDACRSVRYPKWDSGGDPSAVSPAKQRAAERKAAKALSALMWQEKQASFASRQPRYCYSCGATFYRQSKGNSDARLCCSRDCGFAWIAMKAKARQPAVFSVFRARCGVCDQRFEPPTTTANVCSETCRKARERDRSRSIDAQKHSAQTFLCRQCGVEHSPIYGDKSRVFCSKACHRAAERVRRKQSGQKAAARKARKLRKRGVTVEPVNHLAVLRRDKWTCQLCGVKTPERLRGSYDDRAPEVDHIVTLAEGGEHSYRNVQCACRRCNLIKGGSSKGQLRLFG